MKMTNKSQKSWRKKTADCQTHNYFISRLIDYLFDCSRTGSVGFAFQYALLLTLYPVFESSVKFYPKIKQFHTPAISIHETWQVLTYFRGMGGTKQTAEVIFYHKKGLKNISIIIKSKEI